MVIKQTSKLQSSNSQSSINPGLKIKLQRKEIQPQSKKKDIAFLNLKERALSIDGAVEPSLIIAPHRIKLVKPVLKPKQ